MRMLVNRKWCRTAQVRYNGVFSESLSELCCVISTVEKCLLCVYNSGDGMLRHQERFRVGNDHHGNRSLLTT